MQPGHLTWFFVVAGPFGAGRFLAKIISRAIVLSYSSTQRGVK